MTVVFVHGIFSSCEVFQQLANAIWTDCPGATQHLEFNYAYLDPLTENAKRLNAFLAARVPPGEDVAIVAHSMGGLVSRMAMLTEPNPRPYKVRYLIMLATPNHGAIKMSQINGIADLVRRAAGKIPAIDSHSRGLDDLTRVNSILNDLLAADPGCVARTKEIDYVTIPALLYNDDHPRDDQPPKKLTAKLLSYLATISAWGGQVRLALPHDGIVEEPSVRMVTDKALEQNERTFYSTEQGRKSLGRNANVHVIHMDLRRSNHIQIHSIPRVCELVPRLLNSPTIDDWIHSLPDDERPVLHLSNGELI